MGFRNVHAGLRLASVAAALVVPGVLVGCGEGEREGKSPSPTVVIYDEPSPGGVVPDGKPVTDE